MDLIYSGDREEAHGADASRCTVWKKHQGNIGESGHPQTGEALGGALCGIDGDKRGRRIGNPE